MSKDNNELLWMAIVGVTEQFINSKGDDMPWQTVSHEFRDTSHGSLICLISLYNMFTSLFSWSGHLLRSGSWNAAESCFSSKCWKPWRTSSRRFLLVYLSTSMYQHLSIFQSDPVFPNRSILFSNFVRFELSFDFPQAFPSTVSEYHLKKISIWCCTDIGRYTTPSPTHPLRPVSSKSGNWKVIKNEKVTGR